MTLIKEINEKLKYLREVTENSYKDKLIDESGYKGRLAILNYLDMSIKELAKKDLEKIDVGSQLIYLVDCINIFHFKKDLEEVVK
jgi:hypothetical protein